MADRASPRPLRSAASQDIKGFKGFRKVEERLEVVEGILGEMKKWRSVMEEWKVEVTNKVEVLYGVCGASGGENVPVTEVCSRLDSVLKKVELLENENAALKEQLKEYEGQVKEVKETTAWTTVGKKKVEDLELIMKEQRKEWVDSRKNFEKAVVGVVRSKENVMREVVDRDKCVIVYGDIEAHARDKSEKKGNDMVKVKRIMKEMDEDDEGWEEQIEEVRRIGLYKRGEMRPMRVQFKSRVVAETVRNHSWRLNLNEGLKHIRIRKDLSMEQRKKLKELQEKADEENSKLGEEDKSKFFFRVRDMQVRKWYKREEKRESTGREATGGARGESSPRREMREDTVQPEERRTDETSESSGAK